MRFSGRGELAAANRNPLSMANLPGATIYKRKKTQLLVTVGTRRRPEQTHPHTALGIRPALQKEDPAMIPQSNGNA